MACGGISKAFGISVLPNLLCCPDRTTRSETTILKLPHQPLPLCFGPKLNSWRQFLRQYLLTSYALHHHHPLHRSSFPYLPLPSIHLRTSELPPRSPRPRRRRPSASELLRPMMTTGALPRTSLPRRLRRRTRTKTTTRRPTRVLVRPGPWYHGLSLGLVRPDMAFTFLPLDTPHLGLESTKMGGWIRGGDVLISSNQK